MILFLHNAGILLATREELHRVWGRFDHERPGVSSHLLIIALIAMAAGIVAVIVWRLQKRRAARTFSSDSATKFFRELCAAHGIKRSDRRLLRQLAEARGVSDPATLFVEPQCFETQNLPHALKASATELRMLGETLFG